MIEVKGVKKEYSIPDREQGFKGMLSHIMNPKYKKIQAVNDISFNIAEGEIIGFLGPNGAGKSTTVKMLSGILYPSDGEINVWGVAPYRDRRENSKRIGVVFGQKTQLWWNLPLSESYELLRTIYKIDKTVFRKNIEMFSDILGIQEFIATPVRQLSLGQRMRAEIAASLLHDPKVIYLDEPTIGLDVVVKQKIREFIKESNKEKKTTVILTTHDMKDVEELCNRIIIINKGSLIYDGDISKIKSMYKTERVLKAQLKNVPSNINLVDCKVIQVSGNTAIIAYDQGKSNIVNIIKQLDSEYGVIDVAVSEPDIDEIIRRIYTMKNNNLNLEESGC